MIALEYVGGPFDGVIEYWPRCQFRVGHHVEREEARHRYRSLVPWDGDAIRLYLDYQGESEEQGIYVICWVSAQGCPGIGVNMYSKEEVESLVIAKNGTDPRRYYWAELLEV